MNNLAAHPTESGVAATSPAFCAQADDDTFVHLQATSRHLHQTLLALPGREIYWGNIELYHWFLRTHRPVAFAGRFGRLDACQYRAAPAAAAEHPGKPLSRAQLDNASRFPVVPRSPADDGVVGPFPFARGALLFLSRSLAERVVAPGGWAVGEAAATLRTADVRRAEATWPWEDVFLGLALAHAPAYRDADVAHGPRDADAAHSPRARTAALQPLQPRASAIHNSARDDAARGAARAVALAPSAEGPAVVHVGDAHFVNRWNEKRFCISPSAMLLHLRWKSNATLRRIGLAREWAGTHHCDPPWKLECLRRTYTGCDAGGSKQRDAGGGMVWTMCASLVLPAPGNASSCSTRLVEVVGLETGTACSS
jgi:hypothetical protein